MNRKRLLTILGPTASGKTALAIEVAKQINAEIISADSRQVYRHMNIGTGKDLYLYGKVPYHLIDIKDPGQAYDVSQFRQDFFRALDAIAQHGNPAILCGGSGLYIQAVLQNFHQVNIPQNAILRSKLASLDEQALMRIYQSLPNKAQFRHNIDSRKRMIRAIEMGKWLKTHAMPKEEHAPPESVIFGLNPPPAWRRKKISERLEQRLQEGLIQEVAALRRSGVADEQLLRYGLEYKWVCLYLKGEVDYNAFYKNLERGIHQFAKRQITYFRKMEKDGLPIHWLDSDSIENQVAEILTKQDEFL